MKIKTLEEGDIQRYIQYNITVTSPPISSPRQNTTTLGSSQKPKAPPSQPKMNLSLLLRSSPLSSPTKMQALFSLSIPTSTTPFGALCNHPHQQHTLISHVIITICSVSFSSPVFSSPLLQADETSSRHHPPGAGFHGCGGGQVGA